MRYFKSVLTFLIIELIMCAASAKATVELTPEEYSKISKLYSPAKFASLTDDEIEYCLSLDLDQTASVHKYYKVTENKNGMSYTEVSEAEAESAFAAGLAGKTYDQYKQEDSSKGNDVNDMGFRRISITVTPTGIKNKSYVTVFNEWFSEPNVKSYDVIATRLVNATYTVSSVSGTQYYYVPAYGTYQYVNYAYNGTNIVTYNKGFGISMNLVDAATLFSNDIDYIATSTATGAIAYGAYSHAGSNVSLAYSQSYTISSAGYGNVIAFTASVLPYYAGYPGVYLSLPYSP